jgi:hypothetical protein
MVENQKPSSSVKTKFFIRMFVATFCAWVIPHIAYRLWQLHPGAMTVRFAFNSFFLLFFGLAVTSGFTVGLVVSLMQWIALRPYIQSAWQWVAGLILAWTFGDFIHWILLTVAVWAFPAWRNVQSVLFRLIGYGLATGILAGLIQKALLKKRTGIHAWWFVSAALSIISAILIDTGNLSLRENFAIIDPIYASLIAGAVMATLASFPTLFLKSVEMSDQNPRVENQESINSAHLRVP